MRAGEPYTEDEREVLGRIAAKRGVPADAVLEMVGLELSFHSMGRRRGLFPALRSVIERVAEEMQYEPQVGQRAAD